MKDNIELLKSFSIFSSLTEEQLNDISGLLQYKSFSPGETIFIEGEIGTSMYFLKSGSVKIVKTNMEGEEQIIKFIEPGEVFGEVVLFGVKTYPATTICQKKTETALLTRDSFREYFLSNPEIGWGMLKTMAGKLYFSQGRIKSLALQNSRARIAQAIYDLAEKEKRGYVLKNLSQEDLANYLGITRETVSRNMSRLKEENLIESSGGELILLDREGLKDIFSGESI